MNFTATGIRNHVLDRIGEQQPEFAEEIKRKMFTFEDIPHRVEPRGVAGLVRAVDQTTLLRALAGAQEGQPEAFDFIMSNMSSRAAEQLREELRDLGTVRRKDIEAAQSEVIIAIRAQVDRGEMKLVMPDEDG
jgi:flagellar motor switch protein FliG